MFLSFSITSYFCPVCLLLEDLNLFPSPSFLPFLLFLSQQLFKVPENSWWLSGWVGDKGQAEQVAREGRGAGPRTLGGHQGPLSGLSSLEGAGEVPQMQATSRSLCGCLLWEGFPGIHSLRGPGRRWPLLVPLA